MLYYVITAIVAVVITAVVCIPLSGKHAVNRHKQEYEAKVGTAEERARDIIEKANVKAETTMKETILTAKEEALKTRNDIEKESKERRAELQKY